MAVALGARPALDPDHVAAGVDDHELVSGRRADADADEVLAAPLIQAGDDVGAETGGLDGAGAGEAGGEGGEAEGVAGEEGCDAVAVGGVAAAAEDGVAAEEREVGEVMV